MKKYIALLMIIVVAICGIVFSFFYRMGTNDAKALADFRLAHNNFDQAMLDYSKAVFGNSPGSKLIADDYEQKVNETLAILQATASLRLSSLTKNDGVLMETSLEIADLASRELETLKAYQSASGSEVSDLEQLAQQFRDLANQRQATYARYLELAGIN